MNFESTGSERPRIRTSPNKRGSREDDRDEGNG